MNNPLKSALTWGVTFLGFPLGGLLSRFPGPVDSIPAASLAGVIAGGILGAVQSIAFPQRRVALILSSAAGLAVGLALGGVTVSWGTGLADLALQGGISGLLFGGAQLVALQQVFGKLSYAWPPLLAFAWTLGWTVTTVVGVDVERQYAVFGSLGAISATIISGAIAVPAINAAQTRRTDSAVGPEPRVIRSPR